jgi:hypothetical protein
MVQRGEQKPNLGALLGRLMEPMARKARRRALDALDA